MPVSTIEYDPLTQQRLVRTIPTVRRADLVDAETIRNRMAADLRELDAASGGVTLDDLKLRGWKADQVDAHIEQAALIAQRRAIRQAA